MLPMRFFRSRGFAATSAVSLVMYFGIFGSIFFLTQVFQTAQGYSRAGVRPAHAAVDRDADDRRAAGRPAVGPDRLAPADGRRPGAAGDRDRLDRHRRRPSTRPTWSSCPRFVMGGIGMALVFAPAANAVLAVRAARGGRPGLRRHQRDPRGRRRDGRRDPGRRVLRLRAPTPRRRRSSTASSRRCGSAPASSSSAPSPPSPSPARRRDAAGRPPPRRPSRPDEGVGSDMPTRAGVREPTGLQVSPRPRAIAISPVCAISISPNGRTSRSNARDLRRRPRPPRR